MTILLHCGSEQVTLEQVKQVPVPLYTDTWHPVPYGDAIDYVKEKAVKLMGAEIEDEVYGLNKSGSQMFASLTLATGQGERGLSIGLRGSYNKSLSNGVVIGAHVFVCDNLCFSGDGLKILRRNTVNVWRDFTEMVAKHMSDGRTYYDQMDQDIKQLEAKSVDQEAGYAVLGRMAGNALLSPRQFSVALGDWQQHRHEEFAPRNAWSLYNCITEGLKKGPVGETIDRHVAMHGAFREMVV